MGNSKKPKVLGVVLCATLFALSVPADAQQTGKIYHIGYLSNGAGTGPNEIAFRQGLRDLGYVERQNTVIEWRHAKGKLDQLPAVAADLVRLQVECIFTVGVEPTRAASGKD
jgi:putative ABC transport system substrate-binding protein